MDYGRPIQFGYFPVPLAEGYEDLIETAQVLDDLRFEFIGIQDHPYQRRFLDTWSLMAAILALTERIHVLPNVANLPLRPPAMMAKAAASLSVMSRGRFQLGLGAGAFWEAIRAMGGPMRTAPESVSALEEAIEVMRMVWSGDRGLRFEGDYYQLAGMNAGPKPADDIEIWIGAYGPRMLRVTGRLGDGWIPSLQFVEASRLADMNEAIDKAARQAEREPSAIRRALNVSGRLTDDAGNGDLEGPPGQWTERLVELALESGMDTFLVGFEGDELTQIRRFAEEVAPAVRETVARERGRR